MAMPRWIRYDATTCNSGICAEIDAKKNTRKEGKSVSRYSWVKYLRVKYL